MFFKYAHIKIVPVFILLVVFFLTVLLSVNTKSPICDESGHHIASGYSYVKTGDFRMNPSAPPLIRLIIGAPLLFLDLKIPTDHSSWLTINSSEFNYQFIFVYNNNADFIVFLSRLPMILLSTFLGLFIFIWAKELYGYAAGLFSLFLYVFSPAILGNAGLAMLDMGCTLFIFLAMFQFRRYINKKNLHNLILCGITFGLAQSSKFAAIALIPIFFIIAIIDFLNKKDNETLALGRIIGYLIFIFLMGVIVLWATYGFECKPLLENAPDVSEKIEYIQKIVSSVPLFGSEKLANFAVYFAKNIPIPLSSYIISFLGIAKQVLIGDQRLFFMGHVFSSGSKIYYPLLYLIRTPLAALLLLFFAIIFYKRRKKISIIENVFIILPIILIFFVVTFSKLQGGLRYVFPIYPFLFVWMGGLVTVDIKKTVYRLVFFLLCLWYLLVSVRMYPHYIAYFNELVGGPGGYGYKISHDLDWGQDLTTLSGYIKKNKIEKIKLLYFGTADPSYYDIKFLTFNENDLRNPQEGEIYAISVRYLDGVKWAAFYKPVAKLGYSIFVYDFRKKK